MIDFDDDHVRAKRIDSAGRFAFFLDLDKPAACPLPWWSAMLDLGGDAIAILIWLDESTSPASAWTARDLARVALARQQAEAARRPSPVTSRAVWHLAQALTALDGRPGLPLARPLSFAPGPEPSPYAWTAAVLGDNQERLDLCPDPLGEGEGVSAELLLVVLDQLLGDGLAAFPKDSGLALARAHVERALAAEIQRVRSLRSRLWW